MAQIKMVVREGRQLVLPGGLRGLGRWLRQWSRGLGLLR